MNTSVTSILTRIWKLYTINLLLIIPMAFMIQALSQWIVSIEDNKIGVVLESMPPYQFILLAVVFAPLSEEFIFRLPLRFSRWNVGLPLIMLVLGLSAIAAGWVSNFLLSLISWILLIGAGAFLCTILVERISQKGGTRFFAHHLRWLVYGSSILFGLVHITNYPKQAWIVAPFLVLPQTTLGFLLAYVRIRFGFLWSILTHALHNFLISSPILFMALGSNQLRQKLFEQATDVKLLPQDQILGVLLVLWIVLISIFILITVAMVLQEWRQERLKSS